MRERPILFSAPMVRAILEGRKTQTRRVFKLPRRMEWYPDLGGEREGWYCDIGGRGWWHVSETACPYGAPGDRLWVRETWGLYQHQFDHECHDVIYRADDQRPIVDRWRPSIHMPRWASHIDLEVTGVRVERLQDISEADAMAEGVPEAIPFETPGFYRQGFHDLWESINGAGSWDANPWVWVVEFQRIVKEGASP